MTGFIQEYVFVKNGTVADFKSQSILEEGTEGELTQKSTCVYKVKISPDGDGSVIIRIELVAAKGSNCEDNAEASYFFLQKAG